MANELGQNFAYLVITEVRTFCTVVHLVNFFFGYYVSANLRHVFVATNVGCCKMLR